MRDAGGWWSESRPGPRSGPPGRQVCPTENQGRRSPVCSGWRRRRRTSRRFPRHQTRPPRSQRKVGHARITVHDSRGARRRLAVVRLLGEVDRALPAPVDKAPIRSPPIRALELSTAGREPRDFRNERPFGGRAAENLSRATTAKSRARRPGRRSRCPGSGPRARCL